MPCSGTDEDQEIHPDECHGGSQTGQDSTAHTIENAHASNSSNCEAAPLNTDVPSPSGSGNEAVPMRARMADGRTFNLSCRPGDAVEHIRERVALIAGLPAAAATASPRLLFRGQMLRDGGASLINTCLAARRELFASACKW